MAMKRSKRERLESAGWRVGTAAEFLGLTAEESAFVEMKLASGMTAPHRLQDLADVLRLIAVARLPRELALDPYVRAKYDELWQAAQRPDEDY